MDEEMKSNNPKQMTVDIETGPIPVYVWKFGDQFVGIDQVIEDNFFAIPIMTICYKWLHEDKPHLLHWDHKTKSSRKMLIEFDKQLVKADIVVGQNSDAFDIKHLNTHRLIHGLPPIVNCNGVTLEDTYKQAKQNFAFPSNKLDYISKRFLRTDGKIKMEMSDWIDMMRPHTTHRYKTAFKKFCNYNLKDVVDTEIYMELLKPYIIPKHNQATFSDTSVGCIRCGKTESLVPTYVRTRGMSKYQYYHCEKCNTYAGKRRVLDSGKLSKKMST